LPEKNEIKVYLELSEEQAQLYTDIVNRTLKEIQNLETKDLRRRGLVLSLLTKTKQICNHPFQYLHIDLSKTVILGDKRQKAESPKKSSKTKKSSAQKTEDEENDINTLENLISEYTDQSLAEPHLLELSQMTLDEITQSSQKLSRLIEMIDETLEEGEKILIFTQFKQMGDILEKILEMKYKFPILFFHGGVPEKKRREIVDEFQSDALDSAPILILSLKAGGTGLNLTRASTVFHFDRWWNPAVENQATDRAYRIGQTSRVNVYKFISVGTIEEKIDQILEEKRNLADQIITSSGENWITNLSNEDLKELFSLTKTTY
jgi:SNF2 family DNA or RNA helicase